MKKETRKRLVFCAYSGVLVAIGVLIGTWSRDLALREPASEATGVMIRADALRDLQENFDTIVVEQIDQDTGESFTKECSVSSIGGSEMLLRDITGWYAAGRGESVSFENVDGELIGARTYVSKDGHIRTESYYLRSNQDPD